MAVQITIRGRQYTLRSDEDEADVRAVAAYVERRMAEMSRGSFDEYTVALLTALNIASELHRHRRRVGEVLDELDRDAAAVAAVLEASLPEDGIPGRP